jgi:hypothetical protein
MNLQSNIFDHIHCYEILLLTEVEHSVYIGLINLDLDVEKFFHILLFLVMKDTKIHLLTH